MIFETRYAQIEPEDVWCAGVADQRNTSVVLFYQWLVNASHILQGSYITPQTYKKQDRADFVMLESKTDIRNVLEKISFCSDSSSCSTCPFAIIPLTQDSTHNPFITSYSHSHCKSLHLSVFAFFCFDFCYHS